MRKNVGLKPDPQTNPLLPCKTCTVCTIQLASHPDDAPARQPALRGSAPRHPRARQTRNVHNHHHSNPRDRADPVFAAEDRRIRSWPGNMRARPLHDLVSTHGTGLACNLVTRGEQDQGRNAANGVARGHALLGFGINLCQPQPWFQFPTGFGKWLGHGQTGSTPGCPEIHQQGNVTAQRLGVEVRACKCNRLPRKKGLMATPAAGAFCKAFAGHAVHAGTEKTGNQVGNHIH